MVVIFTIIIIITIIVHLGDGDGCIYNLIIIIHDKNEISLKR